jgi:hypothetical protein
MVVLEAAVVLVPQGQQEEQVHLVKAITVEMDIQQHLIPQAVAAVLVL